MAKLRVNLRVEDELASWAVEYAKGRKATLTEVYEMGLRALREDAAGGVPDKPKVPEAVRGVPGIKTAAEVRADPARAAGLARMARLYDKG